MIISLPVIVIIFCIILTFSITTYFGLTRERVLIAYLVATGLSMIFAGLGHIFTPSIVSEQIGWYTAPQFQFEIGIANIAFGLLGLGTYFFRNQWLLATIVCFTIWGWGTAFGHIKSYLHDNNTMPGNTGWALSSGIFFPLIAICLYLNKQYKLI